MSSLRCAWVLAASAVALSSPAAADSPTIAASAPSMIVSAAQPSETRQWWTEDDWDWIDHEAETDPEPTGEKSVWKAAGASALLPGLGQSYAGRKTRAAVFFASEAAIWTIFTVYRVQGEIRQDRYVEFAGVHAGAPSGQESDYYEHIGFWSSLEQWQDIVRRDARTLHPDDAAAQAEYFERNKIYDQAETWSWPDDETRTRYRVLRSRSESAYHNSHLALGAALLNRFISVVDAVALTRRHNQELRNDGLSLQLRFETKDSADGLVVGPVLTAEY